MIRTVLSQLAVLSAVCTCVLILSPQNGIKRYIRLCCCLCALSVILSFKPSGATDIFPDGGSVTVSDMADKAKELLINETKENLCKSAKDLIINKFGADPGKVKVDLELDSTDTENIKIIKAKVYLQGADMYVKTVSVKNAVKELLCCECEVITD